MSPEFLPWGDVYVSKICDEMASAEKQVFFFVAELVEMV